MKVRRLLLSAIALCGILPVTAGAARNARSQFLDRPVGEFQWAGSWALPYLCSQLAIPCGLELRADDHSDIGHGEWTIERGRTPRQILQEMMKAHPGYRWGFDGDALIIVPVDGGPSLLDLPVGPFEFNSEVTAVAMGRAADAAGVHGMTRPVQGNGADLRGVMVKIRKSVKRMPLRSVFCAIAGANGAGTWIYYPAANEYLNHGPSYHTFY